MSMARRFRAPRSARQVLLALAMLAFVLRALVPMGFMPGMHAGHGGPLVLALCNPAGEHASITLDLELDKDHGASEERMSAQDCPFCIAAAQAMLPTADVVVRLAPLVASALPVPVHVGHSPISAQGPPLGSRAPPTHLG